MNLVLLGDSHLARLNRSEKSPTPIEKLFPKAKIFDLSVGRANSRDGKGKIKTSFIEDNSSALVMYGTNDCASWKEIPLDEYKNNLENIIAGLKNKKCKIVLITPPPVNEQKQMPPGRNNKVVKRYAQVVKDVAKRNNLVLIDLNSLLEKQMIHKDVHELDGVHLNNKGYKLFTDELNTLLS